MGSPRFNLAMRPMASDQWYSYRRLRLRWCAIGGVYSTERPWSANVGRNYLEPWASDRVRYMSLTLDGQECQVQQAPADGLYQSAPPPEGPAYREAEHKLQEAVDAFAFAVRCPPSILWRALCWNRAHRVTRQTGGHEFTVRTRSGDPWLIDVAPGRDWAIEPLFEGATLRALKGPSVLRHWLPGMMGFSDESVADAVVEHLHPKDVRRLTEYVSDPSIHRLLAASQMAAI